MDWKTRADGFEGRKWSVEYAELLRKQDFHSDEWQKKMYGLSNDFFHAASLYAQVIISELPLPIGLKSIQPVNVGGIAGGEKYIVDNILFKFSLDNVLGNSDVYMYGGNEQRDDLAMKAASIEMRNMQVILTARNSKLLMPLMCVLDFQGHRIIASSLIPIDDTTLAYGSSDAGATVMKTNPELNEIVESLGKKLNLKEHYTGSKKFGKVLYMPGDIEGHIGKDGNYYMLDVARLMPPEAQKPGKFDRKVFYQTLRPELVLGFEEPLSSDAFTGWTILDPEKEKHEESIRNCTEFLRNTIIPNFSDALQSYKLEAITFLPSDKECWMKLDSSVLTTLLDVADMSATVHYYGINVRHLGLVRSHTTSIPIRDFLLVQIITRVMKNILRADMRKLMTHSLGSPTDVPLRDLVLKTYTKLHPFRHPIKSAEKQKMVEYWDIVYSKTQEQFEGCFSKHEHNEISEIGLHSFIQTRVDFRTILYLFFKFSQVEISCTAMEQLLAPRMKDDVCVKEDFRLVRADVLQFTPRIRKPYIVSIAAAQLLAKEANHPSMAKTNAYRLLSLATQQMQAAHQASPSCPTQTRNCHICIGIKVN